MRTRRRWAIRAVSVKLMRGSTSPAGDGGQIICVTTTWVWNVSLSYAWTNYVTMQTPPTRIDGTLQVNYTACLVSFVWMPGHTCGGLGKRSGQRMTAPLPGEVARTLPQAMVRLRARLRKESAPRDMRWTWSQISTLNRIAEEGPATVSSLAAAEHVRPQSMAETVAALRQEGLITGKPDPTDGRKTLMSITGAGRKTISNIRPVREAWLEAAIDQHVTAAERRTLLSAALIMERLADC